MSAPLCTCGAALARDQRYCLQCGAATALALEARTTLIDALERPHEPLAPARTAWRLSFAPGTGAELSLRAATLAFAFVLGTAAWSGAQIVAPSSVPRTTFAVAGPAPAAPLAPSAFTGAPSAAASSADGSAVLAPAEAPLTEPELASTASAEPGLATTAAATPDPEPESDATTDTDEQPAGETPTEDAPAASTPPLDHVVVVALPPVAYETIADPQGPAPYLAGELAAKGALLRGFHGTAPTALASGAALLGGQAPNAATLAGCPAVTDLAPGTIGDDDQAAGVGCRYSEDVFSVADLLGSTSRTWKAYVEDASGAGCAPLTDGAPFPEARPALMAFRTVADAAGCATSIVPLTDLTTDFAAEKTAPAFSYVQLRGCDPAGASCTPDQIAAVDASLRRVIPILTGSPAFGDRTAILIVPAHAPQTGGAADRAACCTDRPWLGADPSVVGGGRTGALVLSPLVRPGTVLDEAVDHLDALKTIATGLDVRPLGYAGRDEVKGFPRETWERWDPDAADDAS